MVVKSDSLFNLIFTNKTFHKLLLYLTASFWKRNVNKLQQRSNHNIRFKDCGNNN